LGEKKKPKKGKMKISIWTKCNGRAADLTLSYLMGEEVVWGKTLEEKINE